MRLSFPLFALLLVSQLRFTALPAQSLPEDFIDLSDSLITAAPKSYDALAGTLGNYEADTMQLRYFVLQATQSDYQDGIAYAYNEMGSANLAISKFQRAIEYHERALQAAIKANNLELRIHSLNLLGLAHLRNDAIKSALDYYQEAQAMAQRVEMPSPFIKRSTSFALNGIGHIYRNLEQYDLAIDLFRQSLSLDEEIGNMSGAATNYANIGECLEAEGNLEEALDNYRRSLAANEFNSSLRIQVLSNYGIGHVYVHQGRLNDALAIFQSILPQAEEMGDQEIISAININLGWTYIHAGEADKAQEFLEKGLRLSEEYNLINNIYTANTFLHDLYEQQGEYEKALAYYKIAQGARKQLSNDRNRRYVYEMISRSEVEKRSDQIEDLARENELVKLRLRRNQNTLLISALMLALFSLILYILYRQYQLKSDKKLLTLEQSMLRSQMNPHFLFNSLNSIKLYIINNEKKNAVHYLNKFSKLVRKILEASSVREISLAEELETVALYMNIENIRFNNEIQFELVIDKGIDTHLIKIPSLILQPFLENALWHGLSSKKGEKRIQLQVSRVNSSFINISITDNGVGRDEAEKVKQSKLLKRKSVGIDITRERLANFSRDYQNSFEVKIVDLYDDCGQACGTRVILYIPTI